MVLWVSSGAFRGSGEAMKARVGPGHSGGNPAMEGAGDHEGERGSVREVSGGERVLTKTRERVGVA